MIPALLTFAGLASLGGMAYGVLLVFAGSMSDAPYEGEETGRQGAQCFLVSLAVLTVVIACAVWRARHG